MPKKPKDLSPGTDDPDVLHGTNKNDMIAGGLSNDEIHGNNGKDSLFGDTEDDTLDGGNGKDSLDGGSEDDTLDGGNGKDSLFGGDGDDILNGGRGKDMLEGGAGNDELHGDKGNDSFLFGLDFGDDMIFDFEDGKEQIDLTATGLTADDLDVGDIVDVGDDAVITTSEGSITVVGAAGLIDETDLIFA